MDIGRAARFVNMALGFWLFASVFAWPHTAAQTANALLVGLLVALTALFAWSTGPPLRLRLLNAALGLWVLVSIGAFPTHSAATNINSAVVGALVFALALIPQRVTRAGPHAI